MFPATRTLKLCFTRRLNKQVSPPPEALPPLPFPIPRLSPCVRACRGSRFRDAQLLPAARILSARSVQRGKGSARWSRMIINDAE